VRVAIVLNVVPRYRVPVFRAMASRHEVELLVVRTPGGSWASAEPAAEPVEGAIEMRIHAVRTGPTWFPLIRMPQLRATLRDFEPDVVIAEARMGLLDVIGLVLHPLRISRRPVPVVWWFPGWRNTDRAWAVVGLSDMLTRLLLPFGSAAVCYGSGPAARAQRLGLRAEATFVAQNAMDTTALELAMERASRSDTGPESRHGEGRALRLLFVGQLLERKRLDWVLEAMTSLDLGRGTGCVLRVVGDGPDRARLQGIAENLGLSARVEWSGSTFDDDALAIHMQWADVGILPAAGGLMLNQAMAVRLPCICGVADGTEEDLVIDGVTGWRLGGEGPGSVAEAICRVGPQSERREMGAKAQSRVHAIASVEGLVDTLLQACSYAVRQRR
jgi:glycosyltransferase involved in cell wall biosynthesis